MLIFCQSYEVDDIPDLEEKRQSNGFIVPGETVYYKGADMDMQKRVEVRHCRIRLQQ